MPTQPCRRRALQSHRDGVDRGDQADGERVVWLTDRTRPFVIVLIETADPHDTPLGPLGIVGVACE
jgi:hypothetical protein